MIQNKLVLKSNLTETVAIKFLEKLGYTVLPPEKLNKSNQALIDYYYKNLIKYHTSLGSTLIVDPLQDKKDLFALQRFHDKGKKLGQTKATLNNYLYTTLEYLFTNLKDLKLRPPKTLEHLLSNRCSWIFSTIKNFQESKKKQALEKLREEVYNNDSDSTLLKIREDREFNILKEENAKKEKR